MEESALPNGLKFVPVNPWTRSTSNHPTILMPNHSLGVDDISCKQARERIKPVVKGDFENQVVDEDIYQK